MTAVYLTSANAGDPVVIEYSTYIEEEIPSADEMERCFFKGITGEQIDIRVQSWGNTNFDIRTDLYSPTT